MCLLDKYDPLPNYLHIGYDEANRLLGERAEEGPVAQIMRWAYEQSEAALKVIQYPATGITPKTTNSAVTSNNSAWAPPGANSEGADFVFTRGLPAIESRRRDIVVNASGLNDFYKTDLAEHLTEAEKTDALRVGLIGVWTEAKITYLAYELITRYPKNRTRHCSALTASSSRNRHFIALDHLQRILGVKVFDSVASFAEYLGGAGHGLAAAAYASTGRSTLQNSASTYLTI